MDKGNINAATKLIFEIVPELRVVIRAASASVVIPIERGQDEKRVLIKAGEKMGNLMEFFSAGDGALALGSSVQSRRL